MMLIPKLFSAKVGLIIRVIGGYIPSYLKDFFRTLSCYMPVKNFKFQLFLISLLALASCAKETRVEERLVFWKSELYKIIPTGTPQEEALNRLKEIDSEVFVNLLSGNISSKLENIESNGIPCKDWVLMATTEIQDNAVIKHSISSTGRCL